MPSPSPQFASGSASATMPAATGPAAEERFFAPATLTPVVASLREQRAEKRRGPVASILVAVFVLAFGTAVFATVRSGSGGNDASKTPVVLPPIDDSSGLPNLAGAVRIQAESARQRAFSVVDHASAATSGATGAPLEAQTLRSLDPSLQWVTADASSTGPDVVSFSQAADGVIFAVSAKSGDVCAFGRWSPEATGRYVTLGNVSTCRAVDAPATGWVDRNAAGGGSRYAPPDGY